MCMLSSTSIIGDELYARCKMMNTSLFIQGIKKRVWDREEGKRRGRMTEKGT